MKSTDALIEAKKLPQGARFYRCALQVNPFEYAKRHAKATSFKSEKDYNQAIIKACVDRGVEVIAVTDHYRVSGSDRLLREARKAGLYAFPGFEAVTKEGVHLVCLFSPDRDTASLERIIGDCGVYSEAALSPTGKYDVLELLEASREWGALCIAAHVASKDGLLGKLTGQSRMNAWRARFLMACSLPGSAADAPESMRAILANVNPEYSRDRRMAIVNAQDVQSPADLEKQGSSCAIKMSEVSIEGLRQAFLDPDSRIRLASDPTPEPHAVFVALAWEGGFLDGAGIHFNENLNVLIGGRGTGKSTVVESLRYVLGLEPLGEEARRAHEGIVRQVLRPGTKVSLLVRSPRPKTRTYRIERSVPNPPSVRDEESGQIAKLTPSDIVPRVEVYGQHEISELTKSPEKLTRLLERFAQRDPALVRRKSEVLRELQRSSSRIADIQREVKQIDDRLAALPALEETLNAFQQAGLEERLKERSLLVREERVLKTVEERLVPFEQLLEQLRHELPIDTAFLSGKAIAELPGRDILKGAEIVLNTLGAQLEAQTKQMAEKLAQAQEGLVTIREGWNGRKKTVLAAYEKILRELQRSKVDGEEFIRLRHQVEELRPLKERHSQLTRNLDEHEARRLSLLVEWEDVKSAEFRELKSAADKVSRALKERVRVNVSHAGSREPLLALLRQVGGRLQETLIAIQKRDALSLTELAAAIRSGKEALARKFGIPASQAERIVEGGQQLVLEIEELDLPPTTTIDLNVASEGQSPAWQPLDRLSTGQKATAVLLLLLLESDAPLVVDQPEDDLDNRFITDGVVPKMREEKEHRQFLFATHNANVPVLGDAELIIGLAASGDATQGKAQLRPEYMASIDARPVRELVEEILEGGKAAFEMRRLKYGF